MAAPQLAVPAKCVRAGVRATLEVAGLVALVLQSAHQHREHRKHRKHRTHRKHRKHRRRYQHNDFAKVIVRKDD